MVQLNRVRRFPVNTRGRDFVIGDVHGSFDLVWEAMKAAGFDPKADRLFSAGDLIDRGAGSRRVTRFLAQPYVFAVPGNHEHYLVEMYRDGELDEAVLQVVTKFNGLKWWRDVSPEERREVLAAIRQLPLVIEIETPRGLVGIIHAEVPIGMNWSTFVANIRAGDAATIKACLEGRTRTKADDRSAVPGIGRIFSGHTPHYGDLEQYGNMFILDTGAVFRELGRHENGKLTMVNAAMMTVDLSRKTNSPEAVDVRDGEVPNMPFGASAIYMNRP